MRTSLHEIRQIENFLFGKMKHPLVFQAKMIIDPTLSRKVQLQREIYSLVKMYGRQQLKSELENIHQRLLNDPVKIKFRERVYQIFNKG